MSSGTQSGRAFLTGQGGGTSQLWSLEIITLTAAPVWESTFDECIERRARTPMELVTPTATATPVWESSFDECLKRRGRDPMSLETPTPTATPVWESTFDECLERRGGGTFGLGDPNAHCGTSLGEHF